MHKLIYAQVNPAQITIEQADALIGERLKGKDVKKLIGQVILNGLYVKFASCYARQHLSLAGP